MEYDLSNIVESDLAQSQLNHLIANKKVIELKIVNIARSSKQNRSIHKFCLLIAEELNNLGLEFEYTGLKGISLNMPYSMGIVKEVIWRPIQITLFDIESTTEINTNQINKISDVIIKYFGEKGIKIKFPVRKKQNDT